MADRSFRARLRRLFAGGAIVRVTGKGKRKVVDVDKIQQHSKDDVRYRYSAIHRGSWSRHFREQNIAYQSARRELFRDYEAMDSDAIITSALDIYADEGTVTNEFGEILTVTSDDDDIKELLENLFYDILNIEHNIWPWFRSMCKYGDLFLKMDVAEGYGIINVLPLSVYEVIREEGWDPEKPNDVRFIHESPLVGKATYEAFEVAHFRMLSDSNFIPYGKSIIENGRRLWKQLTLMEDAMLIHRIMRAPEKRVFSIDVGNINPADVDGYIKRMQDEIKKIPFLDETTGEYNLRYNIQNLTEDFFLPVRGGDSGTRIENLPGLEYQSIDDIDYLKDKMFAALKIPKAYLGYEEDTSGKALLAAEDMRFARTIERVQRTFVSELTKIAVIHLYAQGYTDEKLVNFSLKLTNSSTILEQEKIRIWGEKVRLAQDMKDNKMLPTDWIYKRIYNISDEEITELREGVIEDIKLTFRHTQIEEEGNDPAKSGQMVTGGEVVDPFGESPSGEENDGGGFRGEDIDYDGEEFKRGGRPRDNQTKYGTDKHFAGRDPIGRKSFNEIIKSMEKNGIGGSSIKDLLNEGDD